LEYELSLILLDIRKNRFAVFNDFVLDQ
jgi:hypothetical protein